MIITRKEIAETKTLLSSLVLCGLAEASEELTAKIRSEGEAEIRFLVCGVDVDVQNLVDRWQAEVKLMVEKEAIKLAEEFVEKSRDKINDLNETLDELIEKIKTDK